MKLLHKSNMAEPNSDDCLFPVSGFGPQGCPNFPSWLASSYPKLCVTPTAFANIVLGALTPPGFLKVQCGMKGRALLICLWKHELTPFQMPSLSLSLF